MNNDIHPSPAGMAAAPKPRWHASACLGLTLFAAHLLFALLELSFASSSAMHYGTDEHWAKAVFLYATCLVWPLIAVVLRPAVRKAELLMFLLLFAAWGIALTPMLMTLLGAI